MSSSVHIDNKGKDILILGKGPTQGLDNTSLTEEAIYILLILHKQIKDLLYVNATKIYQFKANGL